MQEEFTATVLDDDKSVGLEGPRLAQNLGHLGPLSPLTQEMWNLALNPRP